MSAPSVRHTAAPDGFENKPVLNLLELSDTVSMTLETILKDSPYRLAQFSEEQVRHIEKAVITRSVKGKDVYYITCPIRKKEIRLTPEEVIRQLYLDKLLHAYRYPRDLIQVESEVPFGREKKRMAA